MVSQHTSRSGSTQMEEGKQEVETSHGPPPDGSLRGWLAVVGGFLTYVATFGTILPDSLIVIEKITHVLRTTQLLRDIPDVLSEWYA